MRTLSAETLELEVANAIGRYHREQQGKAPGRIHVGLTGNLLTILTNDIYTPSEVQLSGDEEGRKLIKSARRELRSLTREHAHAAIAGVCGCPVLRSYWDLDVRIGEQMEAYVLGEDLERRLKA
ncbi:MAG: DUF2294 domain-containing protein [Fimbriimonas sp.]